MKVEIKNNQLVITLPLTEPKMSSTGKSLVVAGTGGFAKTTAEVQGKPVSVSVNAIISAK